MRKMLKRVGIALTLVVILAVLTTSVAMAAGPNDSPGTCPNPDCSGDCNQLQLQEQVRTCNGDQTQNQNAGELSQIQTQAGELNQTQNQEQNAGELSQIQTQTKSQVGKL